MAWEILELTDQGAGQWYRYQVAGINSEQVIPKSFCWSVPDLDDARFVAHSDAPPEVRRALYAARVERAKK